MDWLYRVYHFDPQEIEHIFDETGNLSNRDPKAAIVRHIIDLPVDPNAGSYKLLIRVPGIGPRNARKIMAFRKRKRITRKDELTNLGVIIKRASPYLEINGWRDATLDRWSA